MEKSIKMPKVCDVWRSHLHCRPQPREHHCSIVYLININLFFPTLSFQLGQPSTPDPVAMQLSRYPAMLRLLTQYQNKSVQIRIETSLRAPIIHEWVMGKSAESLHVWFHRRGAAFSEPSCLESQQPPPMPSRHMRFASQQSSPRQYHAIAIANITTPSASYQARPMGEKALDTELLKYSKHFIIEVAN